MLGAPNFCTSVQSMMRTIRVAGDGPVLDLVELDGPGGPTPLYRGTGNVAGCARGRDWTRSEGPELDARGRHRSSVLRQVRI